jgi:hypothetical protein
MLKIKNSTLKIVLKLSIFLGLISLAACENSSTETPSPNNSNSSINTTRDASLPEDFPLKGCFPVDMDFTLNSSAGGGSAKFVFTYDKLNRLVKAENNSTLLPSKTTYTYDKGKITTVNESKTGGIPMKITSIYTLDTKNRVSSVEQKTTLTISGNTSESTVKTSYTYDANGYLSESKIDSDKKLPVTKYTWTNGNLTKTVSTLTKPDAGEKGITTTEYTYDLSKTLGTWDPSSASPGVTLAPSYSGKPTKNLITKVVSTAETALDNPIISFNYKVVSTTTTSYTFDSKGLPSTFNTNTTATSSGKLPLGFTLPNINATSTGKVNYTCN